MDLDEQSFFDVCNIARGVFHPIHSFLDRDNFLSVAFDYKLTSGEFFPFPISLDLGMLAPGVESYSIKNLLLYWNGESIGYIEVHEIFDIDRWQISEKLYGTVDIAHPGVKELTSHSGPLLGGTAILENKFLEMHSKRYMTPETVIHEFQSRGWKKVVGFATRNVPHRGHEFLLKKNVINADGLLIQPTVAQKEGGKYTEKAIRLSFEYLIEHELESEKFYLALVPARSLRAGPREALMQAVIRRNFGCTHFIIGRDHSGLGGFYERYEAQQLAARFANELEVEIVKAREPYYCDICCEIVDDDVCNHLITNPDVITFISSVNIRRVQQNGDTADSHIFNPKIHQAISQDKFLY